MKPILAVGDIHGKWDSLFYRINEIDLRDCTLIGVGDLGVGFIEAPKQARQNEHINNFFKGRNIEFLGIRGNHDDPKYFDGTINYNNFKLLPDYTTLTLNDKKFLFVGGAVSIDRIIRKEGISYWKDEAFKLNYAKFKRCDVLITHSAPMWNGPINKNAMIKNFCERDLTLWDECTKERKEHDILIKLTGAKRHYCGHFHECLMATVDDCTSTILDELQILEIQ
jgi:hypothetical protein